jgi:hypothetical protein
VLFGHFGQPSSLVALAELTVHGCSTIGCSRSGVVELVFLLVNSRTNGWLSASAIKLDPLNAFSNRNAILDWPLQTHTARRRIDRTEWHQTRTCLRERHAEKQGVRRTVSEEHVSEPGSCGACRCRDGVWRVATWCGW